MGEAKRRDWALKHWLASISYRERIIADAALAAHRNIVMRFGMTGGCYRMTLFLTQYLGTECDVEVEPVIGFVNDGESPIMASHAWFEFEGKKSDITLTLTEMPEINPTGPLLVLDQMLSQGRATYTYHRERDAAALQAEREAMSNPRVKEMIEYKQREHEMMSKTAEDSLNRPGNPGGCLVWVTLQ